MYIIIEWILSHPGETIAITMVSVLCGAFGAFMLRQQEKWKNGNINE